MPLKIILTVVLAMSPLIGWCLAERENKGYGIFGAMLGLGFAVFFDLSLYAIWH